MKTTQIQFLTLTALLAALIVLLGLTPLGLIPLGFVYVTILCVPVIVGTLLIGLKSGLILGLCFGLVSFYTAMQKPSGLVMPLVAQTVPGVFIMCVLPRLLVPLAAHLVYTRLFKRREDSRWRIAPAAVAASLTNTVFYLGIMLILYILCGLDATAILAVVAGTGAVAGISEAVVAAVICVPVVAALQKLYRRKEPHA